MLEDMAKKVGREIKQQKTNFFQLLKLPLVILALTLLIQIANQIFHFYTVKYLEPLGIISLAVFFYVGWILKKNEFTFKKKIRASLILFTFSVIFSLIILPKFLPAIPLFYRLLNWSLLIAINYVIFTLLLLLGSWIAGKVRK